MARHKISISSLTQIDDGYEVEVELTKTEKAALDKVFAVLAEARGGYDLPRMNPRALIQFGDKIPLPEDR